jgi:signal transduction histidine kinase
VLCLRLNRIVLFYFLATKYGFVVGFFYLNLYLLYLLFSVGQILGVEALCFTLVLLYGRYHYVLLFDLGNFGKVSWASLLLRKIENDGHLTIFLIIDSVHFSFS